MKNIIFLIISSILLTSCTTMVKQAQVTPGMNRKAVKLAWGTPQKIENRANSCCKSPGEEVWYYFHTKYENPIQPKYIFFKNDAVENVYVWNK